MQLDLFRSPLTDPARNLALEEQLFRARSGEQAHVLLYRNAPCVVIGRNQNPWVECDVEWLTKRGVPLLRRASGGGAVWHDLGNLNISFILPRRAYDPDLFLDVVLAGLQALGISARRCDRRSLWIGDRKIAGSAFMLTGRSAMIHACILIAADLDLLRRSLASPKRGLQGRFIESTPAHVLNLTDVQPGLAPQQVEEALVAACQEELSAHETPLSAGSGTDSLLDKYRSWDWTYGRTAEFEHHVGDALLRVKRGRITEATPIGLGSRLRDCRYDRKAVATALGPEQAKLWSRLLEEIAPAAAGRC